MKGNQKLSTNLQYYFCSYMLRVKGFFVFYWKKKIQTISKLKGLFSKYETEDIVPLFCYVLCIFFI